MGGLPPLGASQKEENMGGTSSSEGGAQSKEELVKIASKEYTGAVDDETFKKEILRLIKHEDIFDTFEEGMELGSGAFGRVWVGTHLETDEEYAIKTLFSSGADAELGREAKVMMDANHPNLVKMRAIYRDADGVHLVMDLVEPYPVSLSRTSSSGSCKKVLST